MAIAILFEHQHLRRLLRWDFFARKTTSRCDAIRPFQSDSAVVAAGADFNTFCAGGNGEVADYAALFTGLLMGLKLAMTERWWKAGRSKEGRVIVPSMILQPYVFEVALGAEERRIDMKMEVIVF